MTRTFLVALDLPDNADLQSFAEEIQDSLTTDGIPVVSVNPWSQPNTAPTDTNVSGIAWPTPSGALPFRL